MHKNKKILNKKSKKISELRMEILDKKSNRMSRANAGVFERSEFPDFLEALSNLLLRASYDADS